MTAIRALMTGLVDYAGLFPPAALDMTAAVRHYREYLRGEDRWALGRFVVPAARLGEFMAAFRETGTDVHELAWRLSVLSSGDAARDTEAIDQLAQSGARVDGVEAKAASAADAERFLAGYESNIPVFMEFAPRDAEAVLPVLARHGAKAKIRTGGVVAEAIPTVETVAEFLAACAHAGVGFKATAGLHHAVRSTHALTYEPVSARAVMHGFINVFLAAILARRGADVATLVQTLRETDARAFVFDEDSVRWHGFDAGVDEITATRREFAANYGSCSFQEPLGEAKALGWL